ncbi:chemotaxis protein CheW [Halohasta litorea]|uniref:Chemotaxis protein CheW n=1 Tax=Halohasta litorea TaxID=869891 RepID=A0ABD6DDY9_9EURY|nr:chemotaxis protein CheW [Halohasta litorea]
MAQGDTTVTETKTTDSGDSTQILEFGLGSERYCVDINMIDEIVDAGQLTRIPNSPSHVEGVMDLRGRTTSIINPKTVFSIDQEGDRNRIIVFDPDTIGDQSTTGWIVDEVYQVSEIMPEDVDKTTTTDDDNVRGIVKDDNKFVVWVDPDIATETIE